MKIMILSGLYPPNNQGGAEKVAALLAKELSSLGHEVKVVTTGKREESTKNDGIHVHVLSPRNIFWYGDIALFPFIIRAVWHGIDLFNFVQARVVRRIIKNEQPDVVWSHNLKGLGFLIPRTIKKCGVRHIHTVHDIQLIKASGVAHIVYFGIYGRLMRWLVGSPDIVTSPSAWLLSLYNNFGFFKMSISYVLPHVFLTGSSSIKQNTNKNTLLYLGQLEATKGVPFLIETLSSEVKDLIMVGDGLLKNYCQKSGADYRGYLSGEALERVFEETDFLIVPSLIIENSPTVILEAFSHGVPVVASNTGGIPELVADGENGFLFEPGNTLSLKEALQKAKLGNYSVMSQRARERYQILRHEHIKILGEIIRFIQND